MDSAASITGPASDAERPPMVRVAGPALAQIPALYIVALAILTGDAAGSMGLGIPLWLAAVLGVAALAAFLLARPGLGIAIALGAIAIAAAAAAQLLYDPPPGAA